MLCYLADISSMCRLASWQAETTGALGMLSVQEISLILINTAANPLSAFCNTAAVKPHFPFSSCHMHFCYPSYFGSSSPSSCSISRSVVCVLQTTLISQVAKPLIIFTRLNLQPSLSRNAKQHCSAKPGHHLRDTPLVLLLRRSFYPG